MSKRSKQRSVAKKLEWRRRLELHAASGLSIRAFCQSQQLSEASFYAWRTILRQRDGVPQCNLAKPTISSAKPITFAEVRLITAATCSPLEIVLTDSRRVIIPTGFDHDSLCAVLAIMERSTC